MSKRGENIYKRKDGRWEGRYIKAYDGAGKAKYGYVYAHSYREVKEKLLAARTQRGEERTAHSKTLEEWCGEWLVLRRSRVKLSTYVKYETILRKHICAVLGEYLPERLNTVEIERFSHGMLEEGLSEKTVRDVLMVLHGVLDYIRSQNGALPTIDIVYPKEPRREMRVLSLEEQKILIRGLTEDGTAVSFGMLLALYTGLRLGELCALRWSDISLDERCITVSRTMQRLQMPGDAGEGERTRVVIGEPKSETSCRRIPLTRQARALCQAHAADDPQAYICTGEAERYLEPRCVQYHLERITRACGLQDVHFHSLRHTFATRCVEVGFEIKSLSEILGHANTRVTLDRYVHASFELKRANMDKLAGIGM